MEVAGITVWGCFSGQRFYKKSMISWEEKVVYNRIRAKHALPSGLRINGRDFVLQQDNGTRHSLYREYVEKKKLMVLSWTWSGHHNPRLLTLSNFYGNILTKKSESCLSIAFLAYF